MNVSLPKSTAKAMIVAAWQLALSAGVQALPQQYMIYDLGTLGAGNSEAFSINDSGKITGSSDYVGGSGRHAFIYSGGPLLDLGTLGGTSSNGFGINSAGEVTGGSSINAFDNDAFLYSGGTLTNIGTPLGNSIAYSINSLGQVAGFRTTGGGSDLHAFIRTGGNYSDIPTLGANNSVARAINETGSVAGYSGVAGPSGSEHAFLYENSVTVDLGTLGGSNSQGWAINSSQQVAGQSQLAGNLAIHAFVGSPGALLDLGTLGGLNSFARGINDSGQVVGGSLAGFGGSNQAFLYTDGAMYNLNDLATNLGAAGFSFLDQASDINNNGWIVGSGASSIDGAGHAFLAIPVPEPASASLVCLVGLFTFFRKRL